MRRFLCVLGVAAVAADLCTPLGAKADPIPILTDYTIDGLVSLGFASNAVVLNGPGTVSLPPPNNFGTGTATAVVGSIPSIAVSIDSKAFQSTGGGSAQVDMFYHMEYYNPGAATGSTISAAINTSNFLSANAGTVAQSLMTFGSFVYFQCVNGPGPGVSSCGANVGAPFASGPITLNENEDYTIHLRVIASGGLGAATASIDPWFSTSVSDGGQFIFSPGITSFAPAAVPGPIVGAGPPGLLLACSGGLLGWWRRRRRCAEAGV